MNGQEAHQGGASFCCLTARHDGRARRASWLWRYGRPAGKLELKDTRESLGRANPPAAQAQGRRRKRDWPSTRQELTMRIGYSWLTGLAALFRAHAPRTIPSRRPPRPPPPPPRVAAAARALPRGGRHELHAAGLQYDENRNLGQHGHGRRGRFRPIAAADVVADVCGFNICYSGSSDASGHISVNAKNDGLRRPRLLDGTGSSTRRLQSALLAVPDAAFGTIAHRAASERSERSGSRSRRAPPEALR